MEKTLQEKLKEQGTQASILLADTYEFGSLNGFTNVLGANSKKITGELLEKIIAWHKNPDKIFLVLDFAHSAGPSVTYGKLIFSKYNWAGYDKDSSPYYYTYQSNMEIELFLNVGANVAELSWETITIA